MALILSNSIVSLSPSFTLIENRRLRSRVVVRSVDGEHTVTESVRRMYDVSHRKYTNSGHEELNSFWDDGYGSRTVKDCSEIVMDLIKSDGGPPRWFCSVACGKPIKDSPVLLYLPGIDGTGVRLGVHESSLGKVFHVQCLHIPVWDRTPLEGLIKIVEESVINEQSLSPKKPIYLFGGALALAVAARNPKIDLIIILANPATAYERSQVHPLLPIMRALPEGMFAFAISPFLGDYKKMAMVKNDHGNQLQSLWQFPTNFRKQLAPLSVVTRILPKDTLGWRLKLVELAAAYANSRLHLITAQVLVLASGKDNLLPSKSEAQRLSRSLKHCTVRVFEENGHAILLENGVDVLSTIKATHTYRRFSKHDILNDFIPLSIREYKHSPVDTWWYRLSMGAALFSTMENGKIVRGLAGIPDEGPVLIVGNHMLLAFDSFPLVMEYLREKKTVLHALTHPEIFNINPEHEHIMIPLTDVMKIGGSVPVSGRNFYKLLARKSHVLLYPGGVREGLHRKGETGKLFWPEKQEFVRMAVKCGATIIPYGGVGEDDILELIADYNDIKKIPILNLIWSVYNQGRTNLREGVEGEIAKQQLHLPVILPKIPGRVYYMFGKPIQTKGKENMSNDKDFLQDLYSQIRCGVENNIAYLLRKREEDPYRCVVERFVWRINHGSFDRIPSFEP